MSRVVSSSVVFMGVFVVGLLGLGCCFGSVCCCLVIVLVGSGCWCC